MRPSPQSELLDSLPANDPRAIEARKDLRRLNFVMRHRLYFRNAILRAGLWNERNRIAEIGAGDGTLLFYLAKKLPGVAVQATLVDRQKVVTDSLIGEFQRNGWRAKIVEADIFDWAANLSSGSPGFDLILTNLFLHHFSDAQLERLFQSLARHMNCLMACEPRRGILAKLGARLVGLLGCNAVTRHDAKVSVEAGFRDQELTSLWPEPENWTFTERRAGVFTHFFCARRRNESSACATSK